VACKLALNVIEQKPVVDSSKGGIEISNNNLRGQIEFKNVCFTYPSRQEVQVLKNFSCVFEAGKTTALVGPSGSGKSTIIQMIERFYQNDSGSITVDGHPIQNLDLRKFRRIVGYVGQEPVLFNASVRENMKFSKPDATDKEIMEALEAANAWTFIKNIQTGLDTIVGGSGGSLSGGQKQRVAIARAVLKKPRILLLDEATSALDRVNEKIVQDAIDKYRKKNAISIIVIAHRLSTVRDADKIVVLVNGELKEIGNHEELMTNYPDGTYAEFCRK
jgi:ATP-binding cassette subfamily B (MDR/TAP) protein 1